MRYASIEEYEVSNGLSGGVSLYVQGCDFHCFNCFNPETWDFNSGKEWSDEIHILLKKTLDKSYIKRLSILGGEPLHKKNVEGVYSVIEDMRLTIPTKAIWLYTGFTWEQIFHPIDTKNFDIDRNKLIELRQNIARKVDVLVDGRYIEAERDITLKWRGSKNQRVINVQESLKHNQIILWCN